jgi:hypothetical protein
MLQVMLRDSRVWEHSPTNAVNNTRSPSRQARQSELPEVNTTWEGQQSMDDMFHSSPQIKLEGPGKHGRAGGLDGGWRPLRTITPDG